MNEKRGVLARLKAQADALTGLGLVFGSGGAAIALSLGGELYRRGVDGVSLTLLSSAGILAALAGVAPLRLAALTLLRTVSAATSAVAGSLLGLWLAQPHLPAAQESAGDRSTNEGTALLVAVGVAWLAAVIAEARVRRLESKAAADAAARDAATAADRHAEVLAELRRVASVAEAGRGRSRRREGVPALLVGGVVFALAVVRTRAQPRLKKGDEARHMRVSVQAALSSRS